MDIAVIGTGYVGLVVGACLAETGHDVVCADIVEEKIARLNRGEIPIYEPGLGTLVENNLEAGRLTFTTDVEDAVRRSYVVFIAVGTPPGEDGSADLQHVLAVADTIGRAMDGERIVITKSTVPVGTAARVRAAIEARTEHPVHVCANPEFLKEGAAVDDFMKPDRVVLGVDDERAGEVLKDLYGPFVRTGNEILLMDVASAEITKYAANAMLATRISFMNMIARLCEAAGADVDQVRLGVGSDDRIGAAFLFPGIGYGGSCLVGRESALVRRDGRTRLLRMDALFRELAPDRQEPEAWDTQVVRPSGLEVLSWEPRRGPVWKPVEAVTRRRIDGDVVDVRTKLGRRVRCTHDHPFVVSDGRTGHVRVRTAEELTDQDWLPLALGSAGGGAEAAVAFDLIADLTDLGFGDEQVIVRLPEEERSELDRKRLRAMAAAVGHHRPAGRAFDVARSGTLRLHELRTLGPVPAGVTLGTARNGTYVPREIPADTRFWRVVGLYLAEGFCSVDGRRMRLGWSFHPTDEDALVEEVAGYWRSLGVRADIRQSPRSTTRSVSVSSRILATWWIERLRLGGDCYTHRLPDEAWDACEEHRRALLSGLWQGDGSWSYVNGGPSVVLEWGTVSRELADGVQRLLAGLDVAARLKVGRTRKSTVDTYWLVVSGADQVERMIELVKAPERDEVLASLSRQSKRIAPTGCRVLPTGTWVRVLETRRRSYEGCVYSLEVPGPETFVTTGGLVVHNCFPKDVKALVRTLRELGVDASILEAVEDVNDRQKSTLLKAVVARFGEDLSGRTFAVWGLSFKPKTDDMREAPSLVTIEGLLERGARVVVHDPAAMDEARRHLGERVSYAEQNYDALEDADALLLHTEWHPYRRPDFPRMRALMKEPLIFDGRNVYPPETMREHGFEYHSIGRAAVQPPTGVDA